MKKILLISMIMVVVLCGMARVTSAIAFKRNVEWGDNAPCLPCILTLTSAPGTDNQIACINTPITEITYSTSAQVQEVTFSGLPAGVTGTYNAQAHVATISGTPSESGTYSYSATASGACSQAFRTGSITVRANATITLTTEPGTTSQAVCINTPITGINYTIGGGGSGAGVTGLPPGVIGFYHPTVHVFQINGTPTQAGTFNYTVTTTGTCIQATATGTITVNPDATITLTSEPGTTDQTVCINTPITNISYSIGGGGTGANINGLPPGVAGVYNAGMFTISGTPTGAFTFNYTVTTTGSCVQATATGTIVVRSDATITLNSESWTTNQTVCMNTPVTSITYLIGGGGSGAEVTGLPSGIMGSYLPSLHLLSIHGTPDVSGTFNYTVVTTGNCVQTMAAGTVTVKPAATITLTSAPGTNNQTICIGTSITNITYLIGGGGTLGTLVGLPDGVGWEYLDGVLTISGTPTIEGTFNYMLMTFGTDCAATATGIITVNPTPFITFHGVDSTQLVCINEPILAIVYTTSIASTGAYVEGLPPGVWGFYFDITHQFIIDGTPTESGMYHYTIHSTGTYCDDSCTGYINVADQNISITLISPPGTDNQWVCEDILIRDIQYLISDYGVSKIWSYGLPRGVYGQFSNGLYNIHGSTDIRGMYNYGIRVATGCDTVEVTGTIKVVAQPYIKHFSGLIYQPMFLNEAIIPIIDTIGGETGAIVTGLPPGLESSYSSDLHVLSIYGVPTAQGYFNYTIHLISPFCEHHYYGNITVYPARYLFIGTETVTGINCYYSSWFIRVADGDNTYTVMNGGSATMIAGQNIIYYPGTTVQSGGYMHGYISPDSCGTKAPVKTSDQLQTEGANPLFINKDSFFEVYPNPTTGSFTLELSSDPGKIPVTVKCYNLVGSLIMEENIYSGTKHEFSLAGQVPGIYLVRVIRDGDTGVRKIVRQ